MSFYFICLFNLYVFLFCIHFRSNRIRLRTISQQTFDHQRYPIDAVITWVDSNDSKWKQSRLSVFSF